MPLDNNDYSKGKTIDGYFDTSERAKSDLGRPYGVVNLVSESGLYKLIMRSDKPQAKAFQDWVTKEVLPSIRKTGSYVTGQPSQVENPQMDPLDLMMAQAELIPKLIGEAGSLISSALWSCWIGCWIGCLMSH